MVVKQRKWSLVLIAALSVLLIGLLASVVPAKATGASIVAKNSPFLADGF